MVNIAKELMNVQEIEFGTQPMSNVYALQDFIGVVMPVFRFLLVLEDKGGVEAHKNVYAQAQVISMALIVSDVVVVKSGARQH